MGDGDDGRHTGDGDGTRKAAAAACGRHRRNMTDCDDDGYVFLRTKYAMKVERMTVKSITNITAAH